MTRDFLWNSVWPYRWPLLLCLALMMFESGMVLIVPWLGGQIAGGLLSDTGVSLSTLALGLITVFAVQAAIQVVQRRVLQGTTERVHAGLRVELYDHLQRLPLPWLDDRRQGDMLSLLTREVDVLAHFITNVLLGVVPKLIVLTGAIVLMLKIDAALTIPVILGVPAFFILLKILGRNIRPLANEIREAYAHSVSVAGENLHILQAIKSYVREDLESDRFRSSVWNYLDKSQKMIAYQSLLGPITQFTAAAAVVLVLWLASGKVSQGTMSSAELVSFLLYSALLTRPVSAIGDLWGQVQHARGALRHMDEVLGTAQEVQKGSPPHDPIKGALQFVNVEFSFPGRPALLKDVSFEISAGETMAITGENGSGKTTLTDLLMRFRALDAGKILLDGQDIASLDLAAYRHAIALVPQRVALIDGTIEDNIRFGCPDATLERIETAVREADAWGFVAKLNDGLQTLIGERGLRLSGGQRQRIALARALLKKPAILILDEPTAMFDPEGEERFVELARKSLKGRTVILITHRPASLVLADHIVEVRDGKIASDTLSRCVAK